MKVLYVGFTAIGDNDATGNTLKSLFSELIKLGVEVRQLSLDYCKSEHVNDVSCYYVTPRKSRIYTFLKSLYRKDTVKGANIEAFSDANRIGGNPIVSLFRAFLDILPKGYDKNDLDEIDEYNPDLIYTLGENISTLRKALYFSDKYHAPIVLHMMDNIEDCVYSYTFLTRLFRLKYLSLLNSLYQRTVENLAISPKMAEEFSKRHACPFSYAMNSINDVASCNSEFHEKKNLRMVFSGGLHAGRAETLSFLERIIKDSALLKGCYKLDIFTSKDNIRLYKKHFVDSSILHEYVPKDQMFSNLSSYDILIHVESFDAYERDFFKYSMSTKIPEYLSLGMPILCVGPLDICSVDFLNETKSAIVVDDKGKLEECLNVVYKNQNSLINYGKTASIIARNEFLNHNVAKRVYNLLERCINNYSLNQDE